MSHQKYRECRSTVCLGGRGTGVQDTSSQVQIERWSCLRLGGCDTRESRNDLRDPPDDLGRLGGNPVKIHREWKRSAEQFPVSSTHLHPLAVASQLAEADVLVLEYEPPIENGPYETCPPPELEEVEKWDWISDVSPVISSTTFAARRNAGERDRNQRTNPVSENGNGGVHVGYIGNMS